MRDQIFPWTPEIMLVPYSLPWNGCLKNLDCLKNKGYFITKLHMLKNWKLLEGVLS